MGNKEMTREEAKKIAKYRGYNVDIVNLLDELGLIKFEEGIKIWYQSENDTEWGTVKILEYDNKELHLWIGGKHRYKLSIKDVE